MKLFFFKIFLVKFFGYILNSLVSKKVNFYLAYKFLGYILNLIGSKKLNFHLAYRVRLNLSF